ncbi:MAG: hypothetical protein LBP52_09300 [Burkholderiaceae bacterium]|nr:hypothetical protein [Burkholderiaceae bacterium]
MAVYNTAFSSTEGLQITFDYASYDATVAGRDADGLSFYLLDGSTPTSSLAVGGNLGYQPKELSPGVTNGYAAIALDEWAGCGAAHPNPCINSDRVFIYGTGNPPPASFTPFRQLPSSGVSLSGTAVGKVAPVDRINDHARTVRITISPVSPATPYPTVTVEIDPTGTGTGFVKLIDAYTLTEALNGPVPATFKMGFGASTGATGNTHEVRIRSAKTLKALPVPTLEQNALGALAVLLALLTLPALRRRFRD